MVINMERRLCGTTAVTMALLMALPAGKSWAQEVAPAAAPESAAAPASAPDSDIVVTAQRRSQRLQDVPISASVATGADIQRTNITNLEDLTSRLPNISISKAPASDFINIRGVGSSLNLGFEQSVGTFVDGLYRGRARATRAALFDVQQVEVLRGPQTTFFGNNTVAGAINITTRKPGHDFAANASAFYAPEADEYSAEAGITAPLTDDLSVRVAGRLSGMNGYIHNDYVGGDGPNLDDRLGRVSLAWTPASSVTVNARVDVGRLRDDNLSNVELLKCPPDPAFGAARGSCARYLAFSGGTVDDDLDRRTSTNDSFFNYDFTEAELNASVNLGAHTLTATTGLFDHDYLLLVDPGTVPGARGGSPVGATQLLPSLNRERFRQFSQELRLQSDTGGTIEYMVGAYYAHTRAKYDSYVGFYMAPFGAFTGGALPPTAKVAAMIVNRETSDTYSVFASSTIHVASALRLNLGARYSIVKKSAFRSAAIGTAASVPNADNFVAAPAAVGNILGPLLGVDLGNYVDPKRKDDKFMPSVNVQYDLTHDVMAYASYAKGFKSGGFSVLVSKAGFGPETVDAFELGLKSTLLDRRLTMNVAAFLSNYNDLQETVTITLPSGGTAQIVSNVAKTRAKGVEFGANLKLSDNFSLSTDLAYLNSRYTNYRGAPCTPLQSVTLGPTCTQDLSGKRRAFAPRVSGNVGARLTQPISDRLQMTLDGNVYFSSRFFQQANADPYTSQSAFAKIDARLGIGAPGGRWEAAIVGKNLNDRQTASYRQLVPTSPGSFQALADNGRQIGFSLSFKY